MLVTRNVDGALATEDILSVRFLRADGVGVKLARAGVCGRGSGTAAFRFRAIATGGRDAVGGVTPHARAAYTGNIATVGSRGSGTRANRDGELAPAIYACGCGIRSPDAPRPGPNRCAGPAPGCRRVRFHSPGSEPGRLATNATTSSSVTGTSCASRSRSESVIRSRSSTIPGPGSPTRIMMPSSSSHTLSTAPHGRPVWVISAPCASSAYTQGV